MDVSGGQLGVVVLNDLIEGEFLIDELQDILYRDSRTGDARFAEVDPGVNHDSVHVASLPTGAARFGRTLVSGPISHQYQRRAVDGSSSRRSRNQPAIERSDQEQVGLNAQLAVDVLYPGRATA